MRCTTRRDTLDILSELLENMAEPRRITHLLYSSNLSYSQLRKYLKMVTEMGLVLEQNNSFTSFVVTNEGKLFIEMVKKRTTIKPLIS
ncbi:MAG: winged helix-turn-helix domain-containing protein [Nitrosarchaeum sp.]